METRRFRAVKRRYLRDKETCPERRGKEEAGAAS
jgi:hypothetical protein